MVLLFLGIVKIRLVGCSSSLFFFLGGVCWYKFRRFWCLLDLKICTYTFCILEYQAESFTYETSSRQVQRRDICTSTRKFNMFLSLMDNISFFIIKISFVCVYQLLNHNDSDFRQHNYNSEDNVYGCLQWKIWCQRACAMLTRYGISFAYGLLTIRISLLWHVLQLI